MANLPSHLLNGDRSISGGGSKANISGGVGSRHTSFGLFRDDAINNWLAGSSDKMPGTPTGQYQVDAFIVNEGDYGAAGSIEAITSPVLGGWNSVFESGCSDDADYAKARNSHEIDFKSSALIENFHVDDLYNDNASSSGSSQVRCSGVMNLPGWNNGPDFAGFVTDSDADSPDGVWFARPQIKSLRRSAKVSSMASLNEYEGSPGAGASLPIFETTPPANNIDETMDGLTVPQRSLRPCISAPLLQRDDPVLDGAETQESINEYLLNVGFPREKIPTVSSSDVFGGHTRSSSSQNLPTINAVPTSSSGMDNTRQQTSALFQRRAVQREGTMPSPAPVSVVPPSQSQVPPSPSRSATLKTNDIPYESMTEEQKMRMAQLHQVHVAQQTARLGVYSDFVTPSQQYAGQEASERAAKAVQAALLYGMEGNGPRRLSAGSTGLPTSITPQHPLAPGPSASGHVLHFHLLPDYSAERGPGMPMSAIEPRFQQQQMYTHQQHFYQQAHHQSNPYLERTQGQELQGYTSTYPPPRTEESMGIGMVAPAGVYDQPRGDNISSDAASEFAAHSMQLQVPYFNMDNSTSFGAAAMQLHQSVAQRPAYQQPSSFSSFMQMSQIEPRSAPADAEKEQMAIQQHHHSVQQAQSNLKSKASMPVITSRKTQPTHLTAPLSSPRSPQKMKSSPQLRSPVSSHSSGSPSIRKIASNRRIDTSFNQSSTSSSSTSSKGKGMTIDVQAPISPRARIQSNSKSKFPTSTPTSGNFSFGALSFVNYGMQDADELCSAVAPSGSYKVPLKGYGSGTSEDEDYESTLEVGTPGDVSPTKKARRNRTTSRSSSASPSKSKNMASVGTRR